MKEPVKQENKAKGVYYAGFIQKPYVHLIIIAVVGLLSYSNTFEVPFVFDDNSFVVNNPIVMNFTYFTTPSLLKDVKIERDLKESYRNRYFSHFSFALNYKLNGANIIGYHVVNLIIHIFNAVLLYYFILLIFKTPLFADTLTPYGRFNAFSVALLFIAHPVQTEAVTYITQRFTSLVALFYLLTLVAYIKSRLSALQIKKYVLYTLSIVSTILAMKTKENAFTIPIILTLIESSFFSRMKLDTKTTRFVLNRILYLFPFYLTMPIIPLTLLNNKVELIDLDRVVQAVGSANKSGIPLMHYVYTQFVSIVTYLRLLFMPINQNIDYFQPFYTTMMEPAVYVSFMILLLFFGFAVYMYYRSHKTFSEEGDWLRLFAFGIFWFFVTLSIESSIIVLPDALVEHRLYLPSAGIFISVISLLNITRIKGTIKNQTMEKVHVTVLILVITLLSSATYVRNTVWKDEITLWKDVVRKSPHNYRAHNNLGNIYMMQNNFIEAINEFKTALSYNKNSVVSYYNLAVCYFNQGRVEDAIVEYTTTIQLKPDYIEALNNLGNIYVMQRNFDEAIKEYKLALSYDNSNAFIYNNLGICYLNQGRIEEAIAEFKAAIRLKPDFSEPHRNLSTALIKLGIHDAR
ncbi:MAG: tetratricopeptide repeat protein [Nitrospirae bacterium]|nr:tetratricopeptide repeat protein [Nitrospirota bacterium]